MSQREHVAALKGLLHAGPFLCVQHVRCLSVFSIFRNSSTVRSTKLQE